jgi:hypothetical protein
MALISLPASACAREIAHQHVLVDANYWNLGKALAWRPDVVGTSGSHNIRVADLNGDGYPDVVRANHGNRGVPTPLEAWLSQPGRKPVR